jgi:hypothetical protein
MTAIAHKCRWCPHWFINHKTHAAHLIRAHLLRRPMSPHLVNNGGWLSGTGWCTIHGEWHTCPYVPVIP